MTALTELDLETPAFVFDKSRVVKVAQAMAKTRWDSGCRMLYSIKALPFRPVLEWLAPWVDGFAVSSLFEARIAAPLNLPLHITTPGLRLADMTEIGDLCKFVAFNSLEQSVRLLPLLGHKASAGLRVNPGLSFLDDSRYDPCRTHSKLGVPLAELAQALPAHGNRIKGLHLHTLFGSRSFEPLQQTLELIEHRLQARLLSSLDWINLGGGYLFEDCHDLHDLGRIAQAWRQRFGVEVFFEPGNALVGRAGYLVATVIDCFRRDGKAVAVLDTSVNHQPEIFEYQRRPEPGWTEPAEGPTTILAGCTCLAGDVFGEYRFDRSVTVGDRLAFANMGAYSLTKANRFNGYNLPSIYAWDGEKDIHLLKRFRFDDYQSFWAAD